MGNLFKRYENKGIRIGREEGRAEERGNFAMNMIKRSMPVQLILELTQLSLEQLQELSKQVGVALVM